VESLKGIEIEKEVLGEVNNTIEKKPAVVESETKSFKNIAEEIIKANSDGKLVYCRFGK
jgi:hypothetical protein